MTSSWFRAKQLFQSAIQRPIERREDFVRRNAESTEDAEHVLRMLDQHQGDAGFLESPLSVERPANLAIQNIDGFEIQHVIGRGGMGTVYQAIQSQPYRLVALKVMRHDLYLGDAIVRRFERESDLLAKLTHPGIAHVYQSGTVVIENESRPWFAMELVNDGTLRDLIRSAEPNPEPSSRSSPCVATLTLEQKLNIIQQLARAVAYAHQQGVIHRDLKPANILIEVETDSAHQSDPSSSNSSPEDPIITKIVDFGIAAWMNPDNAREQLTLTEDILGTLNYMSPERIVGQSESNDPRIDVYSLGVISFELLTGELPHDRGSEALATTIKNIDHEVPKRLSETRINCPSDLDLIVGKAMANDLHQRYASAEEYLLDLQRMIDGRPVKARAPSSVYRLRRYLQRNRILATSAVSTILALSIGMIVAVWNANNAAQSAAAASYEAEKANAVNSFFTNDLLVRVIAGQTNPDAQRPFVDSVDVVEKQVTAMYRERPLIHAAIRNELGTIYYSCGAFQKAAKQYSIAKSIWQQSLGIKHPDTLKAISNLAQTQLSLGPTEETESLLRQAFELRTEVLGPTDEATLRSLNNLAEFLRRKERFEEAEQLFLSGLETQRQHLGASDKTTLTTAANLGSLYVAQNKIDKALTLHRSCYRDAKRTLGADHPLALQTGVRYVQTLDRAKKYELAESEMAPILAQYFSNGDDEALIIPHRLMARIFRHQDRDELARDHLNKALTIATAGNDEQNIRRIERDLERLDR
ncbi:MAG: serine/threonine-protein kinase [Planctomycetota bacterium]